jgi:hypothetical protein
MVRVNHITGSTVDVWHIWIYIYIIHIYIYTYIYMICVLFDLMFHNILRYFFLDPFVTSRQFRPWGGYGSMELDLLKGRPKLRRCRFLAKIAHFGLVNGWWIWFVKVQNSISGLLKSEKSERVFVDNCLWGFLMTEQCETICIVSFCVDFITMDANHLYVVHSCYPTAAGWFKLCLVCDWQSWSCPSIQ